MEIELPNGQIAEFPDGMPREHIEQVLRQHFPLQSSIPSANVPEHQRGIFENLGRGIYQGYPHALKGDINAIAELAGRHPFEQQELEQGPLSQRIGQGLGQLGGHLSAIIPAAAASEAIIPGLAGASIGAGLAGAATTSGGWKKRLSEGLLEAAIPAAGKVIKEAGKLGLSALRRAPTPRMAADVIQKSHEAAHKVATAPLEEAKKLAYERNIGPIRINPKLLDDVPKILGKDEATTRLLNKARKGDYEALDNLQSDVRREGRTLLASDNHADRLLGKDAHTLADNIIGGIKVHAQYKGHGDIAELLTQGKKNFANFAKIYLENPTINRLVGKEKIVPKNLISKLESDTAYFNKLKEEIPSIGKMLELQKSKKNLKKAAKYATNLGKLGAIGKYLTGEEQHPYKN